MKQILQSLIPMGALVSVPFCIYQQVPFRVTVRHEIESNLASIDPRFVAIVTMAFVSLCVVDLLLAFLQLCKFSLLGQSAHPICGPSDLLTSSYLQV